MNRVMKIIIILVMTFTMFSNVSATFAAQTEGTGDSGGGIQPSSSTEGQTSSQSIGGKSLNPEEWDPSQYRNLSDGKILESRAKIITSAIRGIGMVLSVIILMIIGIKEMTASVEEKSILKKAMPGYILGAIMIFAITVIPTIIYEIANDIF